ncbi:hypothetical protein XAC3562_1200050 [Xanthomonas citri pv. citri]|uniref:Uncharacterized protein n=1 Tax=Xanthomonas citri pv. citri TaxID=611301 RepID=A0A0U5F945_XANCI|nr:hypothetical protein XAC3608_1970046 [Xanthomonas citri pv. citri]CEG14727.1 hypothetical protein XAC3562_1200050 [Xanthomonas citri pv. citri]
MESPQPARARSVGKQADAVARLLQRMRPARRPHRPASAAKAPLPSRHRHLRLDDLPLPRDQASNADLVEAAQVAVRQQLRRRRAGPAQLHFQLQGRAAQGRSGLPSREVQRRPLHADAASLTDPRPASARARLTMWLGPPPVPGAHQDDGTCPECGGHVPDFACYCGYCGQHLPQPPVTCAPAADGLSTAALEAAQ